MIAIKKKSSTLIVILIFVAGLSLLLYPTISNYWNSFHQTKAIAGYVEEVSKLKEDEYNKILEEAKAYNDGIRRRENPFVPDDEEKVKYLKALDVAGNGVMGYIEIESADISLPIYHGTSDAILSVAVGHIDWSYLPIGGTGTHCVMSGHRGLPSAKLFTDLDKVSVGDTFIIRVLNETLTYEVDRILTVNPDEISSLVSDGKNDFCTLVTCTPYGINSHRLLVRGKRTANALPGKNIKITSTATLVNSTLVAVVIAVPILILLLLWLNYTDKKRKQIFIAVEDEEQNESKPL